MSSYNKQTKFYLEMMSPYQEQSPISGLRTGNIDRVMECCAFFLLHCPHLSVLVYCIRKRQALAFLEA